MSRQFHHVSLNLSVAPAANRESHSKPADPRSVQVTTRIRRDAILVCAVAASAEFVSHTSDWLVLQLDVSTDAGELADEAWACARPPLDDRPDGEHDHQRNRRLDHNRRHVWGEAEAMLREGWTPP